MKIIDDFYKIDLLEWNKLIQASDTVSFFQTADCYHFYESLSFFEPFVFSVESDKRLKGLIQGCIRKEKDPIKRIFSRRAIVTGGALLAPDITNEELSALLNALRQSLCKRAIYIEIRNFNDYSQWKAIFEKRQFHYIPHLNFHIDTTSEDVIMSNLGKSRKRDIRTSLRDGASIIEKPTLQDVKSFYSILETLYHTKVKTPLFPFEFFEKLYVSGLGIYQLIQLNGEVIGGTLCVGLENKALYEWFACGLDGKYKNIHPSTLATFAGMKYGATHGYPLFDMMGAGKPDDSYGVRDFKAKFGGVQKEHGRFLCVTKPLFYKIGKLGVKFLKSKYHQLNSK